MKRLAAVIGVLLALAIGALAQDASEETESDNGFLLNLLENQLSGPGRQIRLSGVSGALSSQARVGQITISDDTGPWLQVDNVELDWSRLALLRGRVEINRLAAERIAWLRRAEPPAQPAPLPEATEPQPFALPELPVSIHLEELALQSITFDEQVFGQAAELSAQGSLELADGALDTSLQIDRLDGVGGDLGLQASFVNETRELGIDVTFSEPQGGLVSKLLRIEGEPAIDLALQGSGPLDEVDVTFRLDAGGDRIADGLVALRARDEGLGFDVDFSGGLSPLIPPDFREFFAGQSSVRVAGVQKSAGGIRIDTLGIDGAVLDLDGSVETGEDNFLRRLTLNGTLGDPAEPPVVLPVPGADTRLNSAALHVNYGESSRWDGLIVLDRLAANDIEIEDLTLKLGGLARNLEDPERREVTVGAEGLATGVWAADPQVRRALGDRIDLFLDAALNRGGAITVRQAQVAGNGLQVFTAGSYDGGVYDGRNAVRVSDIAVFGDLIGRELSGSVDLTAEGSVSPFAGGFDLALDGTADDVVLGDPRLDALLAGETTISGRAVRDTSGIRTEDLRIENPQLSVASDGSISSRRTDIGFDARLADLSLLDPRLSGELTATGTAEGDGQPIDVSFSAEVPQGSLMERSLTQARVGFDGQVDGRRVTGSLSGGGGLDGLVMRLAGEVDVSPQAQSVQGLEVAVGPDRITGDISREGDAPIVGRLTLDAPDIAPLAALALVEATGSIDADITLDAAEVGQGVNAMLTARDLALGGNRIASIDAQAQVADALGLPLIDGGLTARDIAVGGFEISSLSAEAEQTDPTHMRFTAESRLAIGTLADLSGELARLDEGFAVTLETLRLRHEAASAALAEPATVTLAGGAVDLTPLRLDVGDGSLTAEGRMDENFDIEVAIDALGVGIANAIAPQLELAGTIDGTATVTGPRNAPDIDFDLDAQGLESSITRGAGLPPVSVQATGQTDGGRLALDASVGSESGLAAQATGSIPLGAGDLDLSVDLQSFPLALVDRLAGNQGLRGTVTGNATVTGPLADPSATFNLEADGVSANMLSGNGIPALALNASGSYGQGALMLDAANVSGGGGLDVRGSGRIPFTGSGLDVSVEGGLPLTVINPILEARSAQASGQAQISASATGSLASPNLAGGVTVSGGTLVYPDFNLRFEDISIDAALEGNAVVLNQLSTQVSSGGTITGQGQVSLGDGYPADLTVRFNNVRYTDGTMVATRLGGELTVQGPLVGSGGLLSGEINLGKTEISIAEGFGGSGQTPLQDVEHLRTPRPVQITLDRAGLGGSEEGSGGGSDGGGGGGGGGLGLDIQINAPNQIFVRGRGLDVELGGNLRIQGTTSDIQPVGQFDMRRGRLNILGQRIDFDEGSIRLIGNLDPELDFVAQTESEGVIAIVTVTGRASDPDIAFSSQPELPEDEVLARVLFNSATQDLSAFQLAQLAAAAAELAGRGPGILSQLRGATGLDDLDVVTQEDGSTALKAGKYLEDNIYVDVQTDTEGVSRAEINLDLTDSVTARGSVGTDGNTVLGIFYERDY